LRKSISSNVLDGDVKGPIAIGQFVRILDDQVVISGFPLVGDSIESDKIWLLDSGDIEFN
jgi:hypothetical protein